MIKEKTETGISISLGKPHKTILFNDEIHSFEEVVSQVIKAIHCEVQKAYQITLQAHETGRAIVYIGGLEKCELVASILEEIRLGTKVEPA